MKKSGQQKRDTDLPISLLVQIDHKSILFFHDFYFLVLYSSIITYCNSEKGKAAYAEWQKQQLNKKIFNEDMPVESKGQPR